MKHGLQGRVALVTGAGRGQGRSHAIALASEGVDVIVLDACTDIDTVVYPFPTKDDLAETARLVEEQGVRCIARVADVRDLAGITAVVDEGFGELGRLDIVSANAGIFSAGLGHELLEETWSTMIDINLSGVWRTCRAAVPRMLESGNGGSVVITSSAEGLHAIAGLAHYVTAKHGLTGLTRAMALELAPSNIRVNSVNPTAVDTPMIQNEATYKLFLPDEEAPTREQFASAVGQLSPMPIPWIEAEDVTNAVLFLASDASKFITGTTLAVDAGELLS